MSKLFFVGLGGFVGATMRYATGLFIQRFADTSQFPYSTLAVNFFGSLMIGFLIGLASVEGLLTISAQAFLITGMLGAFTTFSTFSYETLNLFQTGKISPAIMNLSIQISLGIAAVWAGSVLAQVVSSSSTRF
ncbi:MAG: fluoride efflux transporter CrcB [Chloroflexota bacterium]|nr:fluoride efflux transporter CrcB [Chloroflexota bacterium]